MPPPHQPFFICVMDKCMECSPENQNDDRRRLRARGERWRHQWQRKQHEHRDSSSAIAEILRVLSPKDVSAGQADEEQKPIDLSPVSTRPEDTAVPFLDAACFQAKPNFGAYGSYDNKRQCELECELRPQPPLPPSPPPPSPTPSSPPPPLPPSPLPPPPSPPPSPMPPSSPFYLCDDDTVSLRRSHDSYL